MEAIKIEEVSSARRKILLNIDADKVNQEIDQFFNEVKKTAHLKGFRKGKVPVALLKQQFGDQAKAAVSQSLLVEYYKQAIQENDINPVSKPTVEGFSPQSKHPGEFGPDNSFTAEMIVEVLPKIDPQNYTNLSIDVPEVDTEALRERKLLEYRQQFAERTQVTDRPADLDDTLVIDFTGYLGPNKFEGGSASNFNVEKLGSANFIPGFEEQIVGMSAGEEKSINVTFPEAYGAKHLAGQEARFDVKVHSIVETKLAEVNEDLALMAGFGSLEEFNEKLDAEATGHLDGQQKQIIEMKITQELLKTNEFEVPPTMVQEEFVRIVNQASGGKPENLQDEAKVALRNTAMLNVQKAILFDAIYEKEDELEISPDELDELLEVEAQKVNKTKDELVSLLYNSNQMDSVMGILKNKKVVDFVLRSTINQEESEEEDGSNGGNDVE